MVEYSLRPANNDDFPVIKELIRQARINPTKLDWRRFTLAVSSEKVIGCIQLKIASKNLTEMASLAVHPNYQHQGIARALIEHLLSDAPRPIYLTCRSGLKGFYEKFDFHTLDIEGMPVYYRRIKHLVDKFVKLTRRNETLLVMKLG